MQNILLFSFDVSVIRVNAFQMDKAWVKIAVWKIAKQRFQPFSTNVRMLMLAVRRETVIRSERRQFTI